MKLSFSRVIDLTQLLHSRVPVWPGDPRPWIKRIAELEYDGYQQNLLTLAEHTGTHLGVPAHLIPNGRTLDQLTAGELLVPAVVLDVREQAARDPDYALSLADVEHWEMEHGPMPADCFVLLNTGWSRFWDDERRYRNQDAQGVLHFPGFGIEAASFLLYERRIVGLGDDTLGVDPGYDRELQVSKLLAQAGKLHLENLTNLDQLPPRGTLLFIGALKIAGGTGSPARVLALIP